MRETGWDYWKYMRQPDFVIEQFVMFLNSEAQGQPKPKIESPNGVPL